MFIIILILVLLSTIISIRLKLRSKKIQDPTLKRKLIIKSRLALLPLLLVIICIIYVLVIASNGPWGW